MSSLQIRKQTDHGLAGWPDIPTSINAWLLCPAPEGGNWATFQTHPRQQACSVTLSRSEEPQESHRHKQDKARDLPGHLGLWTRELSMAQPLS